MINFVIKRTSKWRQLYAPEAHIRYVLVYGPRLGGKSYRASQAAMQLMDVWTYFRGYMMRNVLDTVRDSIFQDCVDRINELELPYRIADMTISHGEKELKGRGFKKSSGKDTAKQKSLAGRNYVLIEEAEEVDKDDVTQLDLSLRTTKGQVVINFVFNPPEEGHWILDEWFVLLPATRELVKQHYGVDLIGISDAKLKGFFVMVPRTDRPDTAYIFSNYLDNLQHLDQGVIDRVERLKYSDIEYYLHKIVGLVPSGKTGLVFRTFSTISVEEYKALQFDKLYGLDFGSNDPTTLVEVQVHDDTIYIREKFYRSGMTIDDIDDAIRDIDSEITADSSAKQTIETLVKRGRWVTPSVKGADSVEAGIRKISSYKIVICEDSKNVMHEFKNYSWKLDKFGLPTDKPEDRNNHAIDAIRYAIEDIESTDYTNLDYI